MISPWEKIETRSSEDYKIFQVERVFRKNFELGKEGEFTLVNSPDWVNIIAETEDNKIVFIRQYRFGNEQITLEIPGGLIDKGEDSAEAAKRECIEETGYSSASEIELLGVTSPNPAFMNNVCSTYYWKNCSKMYEQNLDFSEDIEVVLLSKSEILEKINNGEINHSIILAGLMNYFIKKGKIDI